MSRCDFKKSPGRHRFVVVDCLTLYLCNRMFSGLSEKQILSELKKTLNYTRKMNIHLVIVSNEVGLSIVPENKLARDFRDIAGRANQLVAKTAQQTYFMMAGLYIPLQKQEK
jgi:adenosylcobinamide kinase/adenosylcobinamide-phosphate guanylyltransferase